MATKLSVTPEELEALHAMRAKKAEMALTVDVDAAELEALQAMRAKKAADSAAAVTKSVDSAERSADSTDTSTQSMSMPMRKAKAKAKKQSKNDSSETSARQWLRGMTSEEVHDLSTADAGHELLDELADRLHDGNSFCVYPGQHTGSDNKVRDVEYLRAGALLYAYLRSGVSDRRVAEQLASKSMATKVQATMAFLTQGKYVIPARIAARITATPAKPPTYLAQLMRAAADV
jgi:hypothetical protein